MDKEKEGATTEHAQEETAGPRLGEREEETAAERETQPADFLTEALAAVRKERDQYYDQALRLQAEFANYRRRVEREKADTRFAAKQEILRELLNVLDACERGLSSMQHHEESLESYREGYQLLHRQIRGLLAKFGVEEIDAVGEQFDPQVHEAVLHQASETHREGEVIEEIKKGYRLYDRLLRPAQVKVARNEGPGNSE